MAEIVPEIIEERPLSKVESKRLAQLEGVIEENFKGFVAVGAALAEIRDKRLYRHQYPTFEQYCQELWDVNRRRAYQLIDAANVVENVKRFLQSDVKNFSQKENADSFLPANDAQARELAKLSPEEQVQVWQQLLQETSAQGGKITAKAVKKAVQTHKGEAVDKYVEKTKKQSRENRTDFQSEAFTEAFDNFFEQVRIEKESNWRYTSRKTVFRILQGLLDVVSEAVPGTMDAQGCSMELSDREKLRKSGFRIFRMDVKHKVIEEWQSRDNWSLYMDCDSPKALHDQFTKLIKNHNHLKG